MLRIERLRTANGEPMAIEATHLSAKRFPDCARASNARRRSTPPCRTSTGSRSAEAVETIETAPCPPARLSCCGTDVGLPLLLLSRHSLDERGEPVEFAKSMYRGDRYKFVARLQRPQA